MGYADAADQIQGQAMEHIDSPLFDPLGHNIVYAQEPVLNVALLIAGQAQGRIAGAQVQVGKVLGFPALLYAPLIVASVSGAAYWFSDTLSDMFEKLIRPFK